MAEVKLQIPFDAIHGAIEKHDIINRQKKYRDETPRPSCPYRPTHRQTQVLPPTPRLHPCHALSNPQN